MPDADVTASVLGRVIVQAGRVLDTPFVEVMDRYGMTRNAWWLLTELYRSRHEPEATIGEHARRSGLAASSATIATELLDRGRLTRRRRPKDNRRTTVVTITRPAAFVEAVRADLEKAVAGLYEIFGAEDRQLLHDLLVRVIEAEDMIPGGRRHAAAAGMASDPRRTSAPAGPERFGAESSRGAGTPPPGHSPAARNSAISAPGPATPSGAEAGDVLDDAAPGHDRGSAGTVDRAHPAAHEETRRAASTRPARRA
ncbi:hypothetical protein GCM10020358_36460 [Amorphoplanes nipponensis]|uniref:hypothetical protein n=1 Tax=Actinoplanes nipponensis TaxID=135950 RepID=UPI0031EEB9F2